MPKCRVCDKVSKREEMLLVPDTKRVYVCDDKCLEDYNNRELTPYQKLMNYINIITNGKANFPMIAKQIKTMIVEEGFSYEGIQLTLQYLHELEGIELEYDSGIAIVPYKYEQAKQYCIKKRNVLRKAAKFEFNNNVRKVVIRPHKNKNMKQENLFD